MDFSVVLSATVIAAIVSGGFALYMNWFNSKSVHITDERKQWRAEMRALAVNISKSNNYHGIEEYLAELKVKINANGMIDYTDFIRDGHIWNLINKMESNQLNFTTCQEVLVKYISALLKYDWDRSKNEIRGDVKYIFYLIMLISQISILLFLTSITDYIMISGKLSILNKPFFNVELILVTCMVFTLGIIFQEMFSQTYKIHSLPKMAIYLVLEVIMFYSQISLIIKLWLPNVKNIISAIDNSSTDIIYITTILFSLPILLFCLLNYIQAYKQYRFDKDYENLVLRISKYIR